MKSTGIGFTSLLLLVFITLKLLGEITWSWVWVLSPIWISLGILLVVLGFVVVAIIVKNALNK